MAIELLYLIQEGCKLFRKRLRLLSIHITVKCAVNNNKISFFLGWTISRCLSNTPHPMGGQVEGWLI